MSLKYKNAAGEWVQVPIPSEINDSATGSATTYSSNKIVAEDEKNKTELDNTLSINTVTTGELTNALNHRIINTKINAQTIQNDTPSMSTKAPITLANKINIKIQKDTEEKIFNIDLSDIDFVKAKDASDKLIIDNNGYIKIRKNIEKLIITGSEKNIVYETANSGHKIGIYNLSNKVDKNPTANQISEYWIRTVIDTGATQPNHFSVNTDNVRMHCDLDTITDKTTAIAWLKENQPIFYYESNSPYEKTIGKIDKDYCSYEGDNTITATAFFGTVQQDIPIEVSYAQKINFSEYITDQNYVHTDNNFTNNDKDTIYFNQWNINNNVNSIIEEQIKNDFKWKSFSGETKYATFTFDDSNTDIDQIEALFEKKNIPCCFATIPSRLNLKCTSTSKTILQVLKEAVANGGEILSHYTPQINSLSTDEDYIKCYVETKKQLNDAGFTVDGVIVAGGGNDGTPESFKTQDWDKTLKLCRPLYKYSDMVTKIQNTDIEQYNNARIFIDNGYETAKAVIDDYLDNNNIGNYSRWLNFAGHGTNKIPLDEIEQIIDYVISRGVQIVTWNYIYKNFKTTKLEANKQNKLSATQLTNINAISNKIDQSQIGNGLKFADGMLQLDIPVASVSTTYGGES